MLNGWETQDSYYVSWEGSSSSRREERWQQPWEDRVEVKDHPHPPVCLISDPCPSTALLPGQGALLKRQISCNELMCCWLDTLVLRSQSLMRTYHHWALRVAKRGLLKAEVFPCLFGFFRVWDKYFQNSHYYAACTLVSKGSIKGSGCHGPYFVGWDVCGERCCDLSNTCGSRAGNASGLMHLYFFHTHQAVCDRSFTFCINCFGLPQQMLFSHQ